MLNWRCTIALIWLVALATISVGKGVVPTKLNFDFAASQGPPARQPKPEVQALLAKVQQAKTIVEALRLMRATIDKAVSLNDEVGEAAARFALGMAFYDQRRFSQAKEQLLLTIPLAHRVGYGVPESISLLYVAAIIDQEGDKHKALETYRQAKAVAIAAHFPTSVSTSLVNMGTIFDGWGQYQQSLACYEEAFSVATDSKDTMGQATALNNLGYAWGELGDFSKALEYYERALPLFRAAKLFRGEAAALGNIGDLERTLKRPLALRHLQEAIVLAKATGDPRQEAIAVNNLGLFYSDEKEYPLCLSSFKRSLHLTQQADDLVAESKALSNMGKTYDRMSQRDKALGYLQRSLTLAKRARSVPNEAKALNDIGWIFEELRKPEAALVYYKQSVRLMQGLRAELAKGDHDPDRVGSAGRAAYAASMAPQYSDLALLLQRFGRISESLKVTEYLKDDELKSYVGVRATGTDYLPLTAAEDKLWSELQVRYQGLVARQTKLESVRDALRKNPMDKAAMASLQMLEESFQKETETVRGVIEGWTAKMPKVDPAQMRMEQAKSLDPLKAVLRRAGHAAAVFVFVGQNTVRTWVVTENTERAFEKKVSEGKVNELVAQFATGLRHPDLDPRKPAGDLYDLVVRPMEGFLIDQHVRTVMWSLGGSLRYVPISAMWDRVSKQFVAEQWPSPLFRIKGYQQTDMVDAHDWSIAVFANGKQLSGAKREGEALVDKVLPGRLYLDDAFTQDAMRTEVLNGGRPVQHWATHFCCYPGSVNSFLTLGDGNRLYVSDLMKWSQSVFANVDLLCLSACETAIGSGDGSEVEGLAALALDRGAKAVIATLWRISDASTPSLLIDFYRFHKGGASKAESLRMAQLGFIGGSYGASSDGAWRKTRSDSTNPPPIHSLDLAPWPKDDKAPLAHPYYWAPFILCGNWK